MISFCQSRNLRDQSVLVSLIQSLFIPSSTITFSVEYTFRSVKYNSFLNMSIWLIFGPVKLNGFLQQLNGLLPIKLLILLYGPRWLVSCLNKIISPYWNKINPQPIAYISFPSSIKYSYFLTPKRINIYFCTLWYPDQEWSVLVESFSDLINVSISI